MDSHSTHNWQAFHHREVRGRGWVAFGESHCSSLHSRNEDSYIIWPLKANLLVAVADGLGGHNAGERASRLACETIHRRAQGGTLNEFDSAGNCDDSTCLKALETITRAAHSAIISSAAQEPSHRGMACTLTLALVSTTRLWCAQVGDSRLYRFSAKQSQQITRDQTLLGTLVDAGQLNPEDAAAHSAQHILEQAVGLEELRNPLKIQLEATEIGPGDSVLLCSDGLSDMVADAKLAEILSGSQSAVKQVHSLIETALKAGSRDDITALLIKLAAA